MALPKIDVPIFNITLPLSNQKVRYRPFLVKEEKILLMAMESDDEKTVLDAIKQIVNNCCLDNLDIEELPITDLELFFLHLRARSVGEIVDLQYKCNNNVTDENGEEKKCDNVVKLKVNILEIQPEVDSKNKNKIELSAELGMVMRYPNFKMIENIESSTDVERVVKVITSCIDYIYDKDNIYYKKDITEQELTDFIDSMTREQFAKVQEFFDSIPRIKKDIEFKCGKCGYAEKIVVEGIQSFFA
jgi:hypothetical protein